MNILELSELKTRLEKEARKWVGYLESVPTKEEKEKELTRKLMETWLEGHQAPK